MNRIITLGGVAALTAWIVAADLPAQEPTQDVVDFEQVVVSARAGGARRGAPSPFRDFNEVTTGAEKVEGCSRSTRSGITSTPRFAPISSTSTLLVPVTIARGLAHAGHPVGGRRDGRDFQTGRRPRPARPAQHPLQGTRQTRRSTRPSSRITPTRS